MCSIFCLYILFIFPEVKTFPSFLWLGRYIVESMELQRQNRATDDIMTILYNQLTKIAVMMLWMMSTLISAEDTQILEQRPLPQESWQWIHCTFKEVCLHIMMIHNNHQLIFSFLISLFSSMKLVWASV